MRWLLLLAATGLAGGIYWWTHDRPVSHPPGVLVAAAPRQQHLDPAPTFAARGYTIVQRARYDLSARVLRKEIYRLDGGAALAPVDLAVGWGPMSDSAIIDRLEFSQMGRFFYWKPRDAATFPLPPQALVTNAAQMHMIPATEAIEDRLRKLRPGQLVTVGGWLVDVRGPGGFVWSTSLARDDTGNGACEIVWVESLAVDR
jgi:hypothetical protein